MLKSNCVRDPNKLNFMWGGSELLVSGSNFKGKVDLNFKYLSLSLGKRESDFFPQTRQIY